MLQFRGAENFPFALEVRNRARKGRSCDHVPRHRQARSQSARLGNGNAEKRPENRKGRAAGSAHQHLLRKEKQQKIIPSFVALHKVWVSRPHPQKISKRAIFFLSLVGAEPLTETAPKSSRGQILGEDLDTQISTKKRKKKRPQSDVFHGEGCR